MEILTQLSNCEYTLSDKNDMQLSLLLQKLYSKHRFHSKIYSLKDGKPLAEDARVAVNKDGGPNGSYEITIKKVQAGDAGTYSVVATNSFGKAECSAKIGCKGKIFQLKFFSYPI